LGWVLGYIAIIVTIVILIVSMATQAWFVNNVTDSNGNPITVDIGLYMYSATQVSNGNVVTSTGKISSLSYLPFDAVTGGTEVLACGAIAILLFTATLVLSALAATGILRPKWEQLSIAGTLVGGALCVTGFVLYAQVLHVGVCFILYVAVAFILFITIGLFAFMALFETPPKPSKIAGTLLLTVLVVAVIIVAMSLTYWVKFAFNNNYTLYIGLYTYTADNNNGVSVSGSLSDNYVSKNGGLSPSFYIAGGNAVVGTSVPALLALTAVVVLLTIVLVAFSGAKLPSATVCRINVNRVTILAVVAGCIVVALVLVLVAIALYAKKLYVGYSFILFIASSFLAFGGAFSKVYAYLQSITPTKPQQNSLPDA